jgi:TatA/E family protein of Tat protein translocase
MNVEKILIIVLIIVLVTMGPSQLPKIARSLGASARALRDGIEGKGDEAAEEPTAGARARRDPEE